MGLFNLLYASSVCPNCGHQADFEVQFKYGHTRQLKYLVGQPIVWGGNDIGQPDCTRVRVEAISSNFCPHCGNEGMEFDMIVENDVITSLLPVGLRREQESTDGYIIEEIA